MLLRPLVNERFQVLLHSPCGVLFTFPSRYWYTIGLLGVFSLTGWSPQIQTGFHVSRPTQVATSYMKTYPYATFTLCGQTFQTVPVRLHVTQRCSYYPTCAVTHEVWALSISIATTLDIDDFFLFLPVLRCFSSRRLLHLKNGDWPSARRVAPFRRLRINSCLQIPGDFRSLPRLSSPLEAKASSVRSCSLIRMNYFCLS